MHFGFVVVFFQELLKNVAGLEQLLLIESRLFLLRLELLAVLAASGMDGKIDAAAVVKLQQVQDIFESRLSLTFVRGRSQFFRASRDKDSIRVFVTHHFEK